ncbi:MAG: hypothetical protein PHW72_01885 [Candidatus Pacebacteria bacterium]|nr:hypothetical protein [Candidatus Paceibacterota bacterium]
MRVFKSFWYETIAWFLGWLLRTTWEEKTCKACGRVHPRGYGCGWRCPKKIIRWGERTSYTIHIDASK